MSRKKSKTKWQLSKPSLEFTDSNCLLSSEYNQAWTLITENIVRSHCSNFVKSDFAEILIVKKPKSSEFSLEIQNPWKVWRKDISQGRSRKGMLQFHGLQTPHRLFQTSLHEVIIRLYVRFSQLMQMAQIKLIVRPTRVETAESWCGRCHAAADRSWDTTALAVRHHDWSRSHPQADLLYVAFSLSLWLSPAEFGNLEVTNLNYDRCNLLHSRIPGQSGSPLGAESSHSSETRILKP